MRRKRHQANTVQPQRSREELEALYGRIWSIRDVAKEFIITAIIGSSTVVVRRKADDQVGTLEVQGDLYFDFRQQSEEQ